MREYTARQKRLLKENRRRWKLAAQWMRPPSGRDRNILLLEWQVAAHRMVEVIGVRPEPEMGLAERLRFARHMRRGLRAVSRVEERLRLQGS